MNTSTLPKKHLAISLSRDFYDELHCKPFKIAKTFKKNSDQYELLLIDSQSQLKTKKNQSLGLLSQNILRNIFNAILQVGNLPLIRDILDIFRFLSAPRK